MEVLMSTKCVFFSDVITKKCDLFRFFFKISANSLSVAFADVYIRIFFSMVSQLNPV